MVCVKGCQGSVAASNRAQVSERVLIVKIIIAASKYLFLVILMMSAMVKEKLILEYVNRSARIRCSPTYKLSITAKSITCQGLIYLFKSINFVIIQLAYGFITSVSICVNLWLKKTLGNTDGHG